MSESGGVGSGPDPADLEQADPETADRRAGARSGEALLDAVELMDRLRRQGPWESTQTHDSLRRYLLEETYEFLDAVDSGDQRHLLEELGDLLLQVLFHARVAADHPDHPFDIDDVARAFTAKVSDRTHGVLDGPVDLETQLRQWEERKAAEKKRDSVLDGIATAQPSLALAQKVIERLDAAGFPAGSIPSTVTTVSVVGGEASVEDDLRRAVLAFMQTVRAAEDRARAAGLTPRSADQWRRFLGEPGSGDHDQAT